MGLDITSFQHAQLVEEEHDREDDEGNYCGEAPEYGGKGHVYTYNEPGFAHTLGSLLVNRCYLTSGETFGFRAGSYSGYNEFREALCRSALGVVPSTVWSNPQKFEGRPFVEMINFSDCEGVIGPEVAAKLAGDFRTERERVGKKLARSNEYFGALWDRWQHAYELASVDGLVLFH